MSLSNARVLLVGRRLPHNENLGLAYLRAALQRKDVQVTTCYLNDATDLARAAHTIVTTAPDVVGLSLADGGSSMLPLALGEAVRRAGYAGHITSGGQFATLAREWLLSRNDWLDSVVRFAGETPIVEIVERVTSGRPVHDLAGVTTRSGDGPPSAVLDTTPMQLFPVRDELPDVLGFPAAHLAASRGCRGRCQYCGPAALHTLERQEGIRAGVASRVLTSAGVGGVRRRELEDVSDEMAALWHERGVRYFYFVDEHILPYEEPEALEYLELWRAALARRNVGAFGVGAMLRADRLTPAIARKFAEFGLVRAFVGLELATEEEGHRFGRRAPGPAELSLLDDFARAGVVTVSNLMLVHPYSTVASIGAGLDLLERIDSGVFEATRMMVYHGTRLMRSMADEGRLLGNPLRYGYTFDDPAIERFAEIFTRLRGEAFWNYSLAYRTHDAFLAFALARRLVPERVSEALPERLQRARLGVNRVYVSAHRQALALAIAGGGFVECGALIRALRPEVHALEQELDEVDTLLLRAAPSRTRMFAPMRSAAASAIGFVLAACGGETTSNAPSKDAGADVGGSGGASGGSGGSVSGGSGGVGGTNACTAADVDAAKQEVVDFLGAKQSCFSGELSFSSAPGAHYQLYAGGYPSIRFCDPAAEAALAKQAEQAVLGLLAGQIPACIKGDGPFSTNVYVSSSDGQKMADAIAKAACGPGPFGEQVKIVLDSNGKVLKVDASPTYAALAACIEKALTGLTFPCRASFEVCPEYVIAE
ncbi:MAG: radical SAM protein [Myxococcales bacterium]|nr:radical SAM protein [Myxococcales bacterium]